MKERRCKEAEGNNQQEAHTLVPCVHKEPHGALGRGDAGQVRIHGVERCINGCGMQVVSVGRNTTGQGVEQHVGGLAP